MYKKIVFITLFSLVFLLQACGQTIEVIEVTEGSNSLFDNIDDNGNVVIPSE